MTDPFAGWSRILGLAKRSLERTGGLLDSVLTLSTPSEQERRIVIAVTGVHRRETAGALRVPLKELDLWWQRAHGLTLAQAVARHTGTAPRDRPGERANHDAARQQARSIAAKCLHADRDWYQEWLRQIDADGTVTRSIRNGPSLAAAVTVLNALPAKDMPLPVLAVETLGDTKALSGTALAGLVLGAIAVWHDRITPASTAQQRELWDLVGVRVDDLASQVLVLNLPATGDPLGTWLSEAATVGMPMRLTLHQLVTWPVTISAPAVYVCENPAVLRAAAFTLGPQCPPLICTEGVPSVACHRLLEAAQGSPMFWHNDLDWAGLRLTNTAIIRYRAVAWRMSRADYLAHLTDTAPAPKGPTAESPWEPALASEIRKLNRAVMEERMLPVLLADLAARIGVSSS